VIRLHSPRLAPLLAGAALLAFLLSAGPAAADTVRFRVTLVTAAALGATIGTVRADDTPRGLRLTPLLKSLAPGVHTLSFHQKGDCAPATVEGRKLPAGAAGGVLAPTPKDASAEAKASSDAKAVPAAPAAVSVPLTVDKDGIARTGVLLPGLKLEMVAGRAMIIAAERGAAREAIACGVVPSP